MSNETFMANVSSRLQEAVRDAGPVVVTFASNVRYGEEGNRRKKIDGEPFGRLTAYSRGYLQDVYEPNRCHLHSRKAPASSHL